MAREFRDKGSYTASSHPYPTKNRDPERYLNCPHCDRVNRITRLIEEAEFEGEALCQECSTDIADALDDLEAYR